MSANFSTYPEECEIDALQSSNVSASVSGCGNAVIVAGGNVYVNQPPRPRTERVVAEIHSLVAMLRRHVLAGSWLVVVSALLHATIQAGDARGEISDSSPSQGMSRPPAAGGVSLLLDQAGQFLSNGAPDQACDQYRLAWQGLAAENRARIDLAEIRAAEKECSGRDFPTGANRYGRALQPISPSS